MKLTSLIKILGVKQDNKIQDFQLKGISCNSKSVKDGFIFVAINGSKENGNRFICQAIDRGARAIVTQSKAASNVKNPKIPFIKVRDARLALARLAAEFYGNPSCSIEMVGVTGTNGKTSVTYLLEALLKKAKVEAAVIGTINYRFKNKTILSKNTTPGPLELQSLLSDMLKAKVQCAVMEVSSHALDQGRVEGINFRSAIFTNLTQDHLDYHKTMDYYFKAKAKLFKSLDESSFAVINNDDKYSRVLKGITKAKIITYGIKNKADITAKEIKFNCKGTKFLLTTPDFEMNLETSLIGLHNTYNILAALAWAVKEGVSKEVIKSTIEEFSFVPGRLEQINSSAKFSVFVDYAHTEDALKNVIKSLRKVSKERIIVVFGCGGERDRNKRPKMGRVVTRLADYAIITNDNPRSEDPFGIIKDIKAGIENINFSVIPARDEAIKKSLQLARAGDIVLIAGKGHENYQVLKDKVIHFDDREAVKKCLQSMNY